MKYKIAHIDGRDDAGSFRVELSFPPRPQTDGDPWLVLGSGASMFRRHSRRTEVRKGHITNQVPRRVIDKMVAEGREQRLAAVHPSARRIRRVRTVLRARAGRTRSPAPRRIFNGLDLDTEVGTSVNTLCQPPELRRDRQERLLIETRWINVQEQQETFRWHHYVFDITAMNADLRIGQLTGCSVSAAAIRDAFVGFQQYLYSDRK